MSLAVTVAIAWPDRQEVIALELPEGSRVADALAAAAVRERLVLPGSGFEVGIWSRRCALDAALREGDRVEVYRPLAADPKQARRERARATPSPRPRSGR
jgi:putative ubiquitin-RnfH superfamily antitoxin RatB of RatAB toxin-antitoxin module